MSNPRNKAFFQRNVLDQDKLAPIPCGHFVNPDSLKVWYKSLLDKGFRSFPCTICNDSQLPWQLVRQLINLTEDECREYEAKLLSIFRDHSDDLQKCPRCKRLVQRIPREKQCVECLSCPGSSGKDYRFCWDCTQEWKGSGDHCDNRDCSSDTLLMTCSMIDSPRSSVHQCPTVRRCPDCKELLAHCGGCKNMICPFCACRFCYRCLQRTLNHNSCTIQGNTRVL
ncbi:uncharacterized protein [Heptranchias perlo]|uniref:uncharacterized protein n=1 Tax=Heptranchias perlo TaxID=212740 RepID=UPI003559BFEC